MAFIEHRLFDDPTNWWVANRACIEAMLRSCGMRITGYPLDETYLCEPDPDHPSILDLWDKKEFLSATGQEWRE